MIQVPLRRRLWEYLHKGSGYTAVGLALVTIFLGTTQVFCACLLLVWLPAGDRTQRQRLADSTLPRLAPGAEAGTEAGVSDHLHLHPRLPRMPHRGDGIRRTRIRRKSSPGQQRRQDGAHGGG